MRTEFNCPSLRISSQQTNINPYKHSILIKVGLPSCLSVCTGLLRVSVFLWVIPLLSFCHWQYSLTVSFRHSAGLPLSAPHPKQTPFIPSFIPTDPCLCFHFWSSRSAYSCRSSPKITWTKKTCLSGIRAQRLIKYIYNKKCSWSLSLIKWYLSKDHE